MKIHARATALLAAALVALGGCGDVVEPEPDMAGRLSRVASPEPRAAEAQEISPALRTAMENTLTTALAELDLQPDASMSLLHDFLHAAASR